MYTHTHTHTHIHPSIHPSIHTYTTHNTHKHTPRKTAPQMATPSHPSAVQQRLQTNVPTLVCNRCEYLDERGLIGSGMKASVTL